MMQSVYSAAAGLKAQQTRLDTIAANMANVNTNGYKATRVDFKDALYTTMRSPVQEENGNNLQKGSGVLVNATAIDFEGGALITTEDPLDFAIQGKGFFTIAGQNGQTLYTRNGNFGISAEEDGNYLVNTTGQYVLDNAGQRILLPDNEKDISVSQDGALSAGGVQIAVLGIADFEDAKGLSAVGNGNFEESVASGAPRAVETAKVVQGSVEGSNISMAQEMTLLIRTQRAFSLASRALKTADDMDGLANNMR